MTRIILIITLVVWGGGCSQQAEYRREYSIMGYSYHPETPNPDGLSFEKSHPLNRQVAVLKDDMQRCLGVIIGPHRILTMQHLLKEASPPFRIFSPYNAKYYLAEVEQSFPKFDLLILKVKEDLHFDNLKFWNYLDLVPSNICFMGGVYFNRPSLTAVLVCGVTDYFSNEYVLPDSFLIKGSLLPGRSGALLMGVDIRDHIVRYYPLGLASSSGFYKNKSAALFVNVARILKKIKGGKL